MFWWHVCHQNWPSTIPTLFTKSSQTGITSWKVSVWFPAERAILGKEIVEDMFNSCKLVCDQQECTNAKTDYFLTQQSVDALSLVFWMPEFCTLIDAKADCWKIALLEWAKDCRHPSWHPQMKTIDSGQWQWLWGQQWSSGGQKKKGIRWTQRRKNIHTPPVLCSERVFRKQHQCRTETCG